jgi:hypothetical protein
MIRFRFSGRVGATSSSIAAVCDHTSCNADRARGLLAYRGRTDRAEVPLLLERLETGDITLTTIGLLAPHLTPDNHQQLVEAARHKKKREVEQLVAARQPQPRWRLPYASCRGQRDRKPLDAERYRVQFTVTSDTFDKLRRVQD